MPVPVKQQRKMCEMLKDSWLVEYKESINFQIYGTVMFFSTEYSSVNYARVSITCEQLFKKLYSMNKSIQFASSAEMLQNNSARKQEN